MTDRSDAIAAVINGALADIISARITQDDALAQSRAAAAGMGNAREGVMAELAHLADTGNWTPAEIEAGSKLAVSRHNDKAQQKSLNTYLGEAKRAMHPGVRARFVEILTVRDDAWAAEKADKTAPRPCATAFVRGYHMLCTLLTEGAEGRFYDATTVVQFALSKDPARDPAKMLAKLQGMIEELQLFQASFPVSAVGEAVAKLQTVTADSLLPKPKVATKPATALPVVKPAAVAPVAKVSHAVVPMPGAVDIFGDEIDELQGHYSVPKVA